MDKNSKKEDNLISAFVICQDEIKTIKQTIDSLQKVADEIIVVDSGSTDGTLEYLKSVNVKLYEHPFHDYVSQKVYAQSLCKHSWLLNLDGDEELDNDLVREILKLKKLNHMNPKAYQMNFYFVDPIKNRKSKLNPYIGAVRFYHKDAALYTLDVDSLYKDRPILKNGFKPLILKHPVWHRSKKNTSQLLNKMNIYTDLQAKEILQKKKKVFPFLSFILIPFLFIKFFFLRRYFMLGIYGFYDSFFMAQSRFLRDLKVQEKLCK